MKNTKGGVTGKGFDVLGQPSPEAKSKGWERRREAQEITDELMKIKNLSYAQLEEMKSDIKLHPDKYTVMQVKLMQYMSSSKLTVDWLDRHVSRAPIQTDITSDGKPLQAVSFDIFGNKDDTNTGE